MTYTIRATINGVTLEARTHSFIKAYETVKAMTHEWPECFADSNKSQTDVRLQASEVLHMVAEKLQEDAPVHIIRTAAILDVDLEDEE